MNCAEIRSSLGEFDELSGHNFTYTFQGSSTIKINLIRKMDSSDISSVQTFEIVLR